MSVWRTGAALTALFCISTIAGWLFATAGAPLPWMLGPLIVTAAIFMTIAPSVTVPVRLRPIGQIVVATQVGLAFTPAALVMLAQVAPMILTTVFATLGCILATGWVVARTTGQPLAQAFLSAAPTSPVEAAAMARSAGFDAAPVIMSQTIRLGAVVIILPFTLFAIDGRPGVSRDAISFALTDTVGIAILAGLGIAAALAFRRLRVPNPNFMGPMTVAAVVSAAGFGLMPYPPLVLAGAQIVLGTWLGATFRREMATTALRQTAISLFAALLLLALCSLCAIAIAAIWEMDWRGIVLGAAPGGAVEMALTAKFLQQNVVLITTFHLVRIFILMPNIPWIVRRLARYDNTRGHN